MLSEKQVAGQLIDKLSFQYVHNDCFGHMNLNFSFVLFIPSNKYLRLVENVTDMNHLTRFGFSQVLFLLLCLSI